MTRQRSSGSDFVTQNISPHVPSDAFLFRKSSCACGGGCPACQSKSSGLKVSQPGDAAEIEADQIADKVMRTPLGNDPATHSHAKVSDDTIHRQPTTPSAEEEPDPIGEGLSTVAENLGENNPAFSELTERLADSFLSQPAPISVGIPTFLGANYAFIWAMAVADPTMRRHFNDFNFGTIPGIVPQFPLKTFTYRILNEEQTQFEFDVGLDASGLIEMLNEGAFNTHISTLSAETTGRLNTETPSVGLSSLNVNLGLFDDGLMFSGGFRQGVDPYPLFERDPNTGEGSRIMQQVPGLPDLFPGQQDIRFMIQVDLFRLYNHFNPSSTPISSVPQEVEGDRIERKPAGRNTAVDSTSHPDHVRGAISSGGQPLDSRTQSFFEPRLGYDLSSVRIHTGAAASESASAVDARAYTLGNNIVFGRGEYSPMSESGRHLLAHELAHVVQHSADTARSPVIHRFCINDAETCAENCGQPGSFVAAGQQQAAPWREQRAEQIRDEPEEATASGHSRRATNLETIARNEGLLPHPSVSGIYVDNDIPDEWGAYRTPCRAFATWVIPYTGPPDASCLFFRDEDELAAQEFLTDRSAAVLNDQPREEWLVTVQRYMAHEFQHVSYRTSAHGNLASPSCARNTTMYTDSRGRNYDLDHLLSELSAEISEFLPIYNSLRRTTGPGQYETMRSGAINAFDSKISGCGESIRGILRAIRCHCNCDETDFYIRDTVEFTTSHWPRHVTSLFTDMMLRDEFSDSAPGRIDRLAWPIPEIPDCIRVCEESFTQCTQASRTGATLCLAQRSSCRQTCR